MSIDVFTQDLITRIKGISLYNQRVGLAVGGQEIDPINRELARPAVWVVYTGDSPVSEQSLNPCQSLISLNYVVKILVDYDNESNLISTHLPLLHQTVQAVQGGEPVPGSKWSYNGQGLESLEPDRMVWNQQYSIIMGI